MPSTCSSRPTDRRGRRPQARSGRPGNASGPGPPGRRQRSGRPPAPARPGGASADEASSARRGRADPACGEAATARRTARRARRRPAPCGRRRPARDRARRQARAAPPRARPREKRHVSDGESYVRDVKNSADPGCTIQSGERRIDAQGMRLRLLRDRLRLHGLRLLEAGFSGEFSEGRGYNGRPRGCGGIGRRARFRSV